MIKRLSGVLIVLGLAALVLSACGGSAPIVLAEAEIREYEGQKLSSVNDFRENSIAGPQYVARDEYRLEVAGLVGKPLSLAYGEVLKGNRHYKKVVTLHCVEGWDATILWEGVLIADILQEAGVEEGANTVVFFAEDGYTSSLPLEYVREKNIMLAYKMNEVQLPPERGFPFQVVAESKWGYKWVRWVNKIELSDDPEYRGYWESRGYSNDADQPGPIF